MKLWSLGIGRVFGTVAMPHLIGLGRPIYGMSDVGLWYEQPVLADGSGGGEAAVGCDGELAQLFEHLAGDVLADGDGSSVVGLDLQAVDEL